MSYPRATGDLRTPAGVAALRQLLGDDRLVHAVASGYPTWSAFAAATTADRAHLLGHRAVQVPAQPPAVPVPPPGVAAVTRYCAGYPDGLREDPTPPALLHLAGRLPATPMLAVVGAANPSATGVEIARAAALAAATSQTPVVLPLTSGVCDVAARTVLDAGGTLVVVVPHGLGVGATNTATLEAAVAGGGAVLSPFPPQTPVTEATRDRAGGVAALIGQAVLLAEVGPNPGAAQAPTAAAVAAGRYLIVPRPLAAPASGRYIPPSAYGTAVFTSPREWTEEFFGTNARIGHRCAQGLTPADAVVSTTPELAAAIAVGCAPRSETHRL